MPGPVRSSVAMCTYNGARFLREQLASVAAQRVLPDELVVCDDGSSDETVDELHRFAAISPFPVQVVVNEVNLGSTRNFEQAIRRCRGEIIFLADQDDVWHPEKIARIEDVFRAAPQVGAVFTDADIVDQDLRPSGDGLWDAVEFSARERRRVQRGSATGVLLRHNVVTGATMAFRSRYVPLVTPIPANWIHDGWIALLISAVARLGCIDERLVQYRQHGRNQVGAVKMGLERQVRVAVNAPRDAYARTVEQFEALRERIPSTPELSVDPHLAALVQEKIDHWTGRWRLPKRPVARTAWVVSELARGRYHRYGRGLRAAVKDLLLP